MPHLPMNDKSTSGKIKVIVADDHQLVIDGIRSLLSTVDNIDVIGEALDGRELLKLLETHSPDLILMDINMPNMDGMKATEKIREQYGDIKVLVLSTYDDVRLVREILKLGARGYILKSSSKDEMINAIQTLHQGGNYFSRELSDKMMRSMMQDGSLDNSREPLLPVSLTRRETEVLRLIAMEYTGNEISEQLHISINTVETHRKNLLRKLKAKNTAGLVRYAMKHDLI